MSSSSVQDALADWPLAGKRASSLPADTLETQASRYHTVNDYLIPHYPPDDETRKHRDEELLEKRIRRFFYSCEPRLDVEWTRDEINADIARFDANVAAINVGRANSGKEPFSLAIPYRSMTDRERLILSDGANIVGAAVNRLGRLGKIIIQGNRTGVKIEYDDAYVAEHMADIEKEFSDLHRKLTDDAHQSLVRCVLTRKGRVDHDGVFHHLIREIQWPVIPYLSRYRSSVSEDESIDAPAVVLARKNIMTDIGHCLESIDEVNEAIGPIYKSKKFAQVIDDVCRAREAETPLFTPRTNDLNLRSFTATLEEYVELSRARASIKSDDHANIRPVASRLRHLRDVLAVQQATLFKYADTTGDLHLRNSIKLIARGIEMVEELMEIRLPRNHRATDIYDKNLPAFEGRDASSVGRFKEKVARDVGRWQDTPEVTVRTTEPHGRVGTALACALTAKEMSAGGRR